MKRLYVAGPFSCNNVSGVLENMRRGIRKSAEKFMEGWAPFCPWLDYHFTLVLRDGESLSLQNYYDYSIAWMEVADAVYVLNGWRESKGTLVEIARAMELGIPVTYEEDEDKAKAPEEADEEPYVERGWQG